MPLNINATLNLAKIQGLDGLSKGLNKALGPLNSFNLSNFKGPGQAVINFINQLDKAGVATKNLKTNLKGVDNAFGVLFSGQLKNGKAFLQILQNTDNLFNKSFNSANFQKKLSGIREALLKSFPTGGGKERAGQFFDQFITERTVSELKKRGQQIKADAIQSAKDTVRATADIQKRIRERLSGFKRADAEEISRKTSSIGLAASTSAARQNRRAAERKEQLEDQKRLESEARKLSDRTAADLQKRIRENLAGFKQSDSEELSRKKGSIGLAANTSAARQRRRAAERQEQLAAEREFLQQTEEDNRRRAKNAQAGVKAANDRAGSSLRGRVDARLAQFKEADRNSANIAKEALKAETALNKQAAAIARNTLSFDKFTSASVLAAKRFTAFLIPSTILFGSLSALSSATRDSLEFEKVLTRIEQAVDPTKNKLKELQNTILNLAADTGTSGTELAAGIEIFAQAGIKDIGALNAIAKQLAQIPLAATFGSIAETSEGLLAVFGQFNKGAEDTAEVLDLVNQFAKDFAVTSKDLFEGIKRGGSAFSVAGGSLTEFISLFSVLEETTRLSSTTLGVFFKTGAASLLSSGSQNILKEIGVQIGEGTTLVGQLEELAAVFDTNKFSGNEKINIASKLVGQRQFGNLLSLTRGLADPEIKRRVDDSLRNAPGSLGESTKKSADDINKSIARIRESFKNLFRDLIENQALKDLIGTFSSLTGTILKLAGSLSSLVLPIGALGLGKLVQTSGKFGKEFLTEISGGVSRNRLLQAAEETFPFKPGQSAAEQAAVIQQRQTRADRLGILTRGRNRQSAPSRIGAAIRDPSLIGGGIAAAGFISNTIGGESAIGNALSNGGIAASIAGIFNPVAAVTAGLIVGFKALTETIEKNRAAELNKLITNESGSKLSAEQLSNLLLNGPQSQIKDGFFNRIQSVFQGPNFGADNINTQRQFGVGAGRIRNISGARLSASASIIEQSALTRSQFPEAARQQDDASRELLKKITADNVGADSNTIRRKFLVAQKGNFLNSTISAFENLPNLSKNERANATNEISLALQGLADASFRAIGGFKTLNPIIKSQSDLLKELNDSINQINNDFNNISIKIFNAGKEFNKFEDSLDIINTDRLRGGIPSVSSDPLTNLRNIQKSGESSVFTQNDASFLVNNFAKAISEADLANKVLSTGSNRAALGNFTNLNTNAEDNGVVTSLVDRFTEALAQTDSTSFQKQVKDLTKSSESEIIRFLTNIDDIAKKSAKNNEDVLKDFLDSRDLIQTSVEARNADLSKAQESIKRENELKQKQFEISQNLIQTLSDLDNKIIEVDRSIKDLTRNQLNRVFDQNAFGIRTNNNLTPGQGLRDTLSNRQQLLSGLNIQQNRVPSDLIAAIERQSLLVNTFSDIISRNPGGISSDSVSGSAVVKTRNDAATELNKLLNILNQTISSTNTNLADYDKATEIIQGSIELLNDEIRKQIEADRQRGQTFLNTSPKDFAQQKSVLNQFVKNSQGGNFTDAALKLSQDQLSVLQDILRIFGNTVVPGTGGSNGNDILNKIFETVNGRGLNRLTKDLPISKEERETERLRRINLRKEERRIAQDDKLNRSVRGTRNAEDVSRLIDIRKELRTNPDEIIRQNRQNTLNNPQQQNLDKINILQQKQEDLIKLQYEATKNAIELQNTQKQVLKDNVSFNQSQLAILSQLSIAALSLEASVKASDVSTAVKNIDTTLQSLNTNIGSQAQSFNQFSSSLKALDKSQDIINSINPIYQSVQNIEKILQKLGTGTGAATLEIKPIQVNVVLDAPDILKLAGPQLFESIMDKLTPAIGAALGVVSEESRSKFETSIGRR